MASMLGVDVGGTFTDFFLWLEDGLRVYKRPSTPHDPAEAIVKGLDETGWRPQGVVHGSTVATNAVLERKGARTALITTRGFRDVLAIGRQTRPKLYELEPQRPPPIIPDGLCLEVGERVDHTGTVLVPLDTNEVECVLSELEETGVESVAICFLFSFLNPGHERLIAEKGRSRSLFVSASHEILPEHREYERTSTTVLNAYVSPVMSRYLGRLEEELASRGVGWLRIMQSGGGSAAAGVAGALAVRTLLSGPAAGVVGAFEVARRVGSSDIITFDMGGTSTDVCLCPGHIPTSPETVIGEYPVRTPVVDIHTVGAGGGSIARLDAGGALRVGPESAGAEPGPACYGRGDEPTVTDAQLLLGRLVPERFLGGRMAVSEERAADALGRLAGAFKDDRSRAAQGVVRVVNANMEKALRVISVERGYDPRRFTLVAFGGAGPLHACDLAEALKIPQVLVPRFPGVLSAFGALSADVAKDYSQAFFAAVPSEDEPVAELHRKLEAVFSGLEGRGREAMAVEGQRDLHFLRELDLRYVGQSYELTVTVDEPQPSRFLPRFHELHQSRYGHCDRSRAVEVVTVRLKVTAPTEEAPLPLLPEGEAEASGASLGSRPVWFGEAMDASMYDRERLLAGNRILGPALVVQMDATTAVPPGWTATVDRMADLLLERAR